MAGAAQPGASTRPSPFSSHLDIGLCGDDSQHQDDNVEFHSGAGTSWMGPPPPPLGVKMQKTADTFISELSNVVRDGNADMVRAISRQMEQLRIMQSASATSAPAPSNAGSADDIGNEKLPPHIHKHVKTQLKELEDRINELINLKNKAEATSKQLHVWREGIFPSDLKQYRSPQTDLSELISPSMDSFTVDSSGLTLGEAKEKMYHHHLMWQIGTDLQVLNKSITTTSEKISLKHFTDKCIEPVKQRDIELDDFQSMLGLDMPDYDRVTKGHHRAC